MHWEPRCWCVVVFLLFFFFVVVVFFHFLVYFAKTCPYLLPVIEKDKDIEALSPIISTS